MPAAQTECSTTERLPAPGSQRSLTEGTRFPRSIRSLISLLLSDSDSSSLRRSSPGERCVNPYFSTSFLHCVPLPEPGPPRKEVACQTRILSLVSPFQLRSPWWASFRASFIKHVTSTFGFPGAVLGDVDTMENGFQSLPSRAHCAQTSKQPPPQVV